MNEIELRKEYFVSLSMGKDSYFMWLYILNNLDRYKLTGCVNFKCTGAEFEWMDDLRKDVADKCKQLGIPFYVFEPRDDFKDLANKHGIANGKAVWCRSWKLQAKEEFTKYMNSVGIDPVFYLGICYDEPSRIKDDPHMIYPLYDNRICERPTILNWARYTVPELFGNFYSEEIGCERSGCKYCCFANKNARAYLAHYEPENFKWFMEKCRETEQKYNASVFGNKKYNTDYQERKALELEKQIWGYNSIDVIDI